MIATNNQIYLTGNTKLLIVLVTLCFFMYMVYNDNWFQGLLILNISLHYREFIEYFTDFSDEIIYPEHLLKSKEKEKNIEGFSGNINSLLGPANIDITDTYNNYYNELYDDNVNNELQYSSYFNNNINKIKQHINDENNVAENFYNQLFNKHEKKILNKSNNNEHFVHYKLGETNSDDMNEFGSFSKLKFQRDQKIYNRAKQPFANDDIKLMSHIDLNHNIPWWQLSQELDFY